MINTIRDYIKSNALPSPPCKLIVTVSGGADSVALLHILIELGYECIVAHCNFHLRGEESDRDAQFVSALAEKLHIEYLSKDFDTREYAQTNKLSIEMAARELRYAWFEELRKEHQAEAIAVAHHANDVMETFLMNITRGTGIHGLTGIKPRNGYVIRPLLAISRLDIETYLSEKSISFVVDSTNLEQYYTRNKFRHSILPLLEEVNPSVKDTIIDTIKRLEEVETLYNQQVEQIKSTIITASDDGFLIDINLLQKQAGISSILYEILSPLGFSASTIQSVITSLTSESGKQFFSTNYRVIKDRNHLIVSPISEKEDKEYSIERNQDEIRVPIHLKFEYLKKDKITIEKDRNYAFLDVNKLKFPLILRKWQKGDYFFPFGMKGKKKLSDYFIDNKFSLNQKEKTWVLISGNDLVWVVGERIDQRFSVSSISKEILKIKLII